MQSVGLPSTGNTLSSELVQCGSSLQSALVFQISGRGFLRSSTAGDVTLALVEDAAEDPTAMKTAIVAEVAGNPVLQSKLTEAGVCSLLRALQDDRFCNFFMQDYSTGDSVGTARRHNVMDCNKRAQIFSPSKCGAGVAIAACGPTNRRSR